MFTQHHQLLAVLGHPGDEWRGSVVLALRDDRVVDEVTGESVGRSDLQAFLAQAERYANNLRYVLGQPG